MVCWTARTDGEAMTTYYDVPADLLITGLAEKMTTFEKIVAPEWDSQVKTGPLPDFTPT